mgnify:CR=1 FL=1
MQSNGMKGQRCCGMNVRALIHYFHQALPEGFGSGVGFGGDWQNLLDSVRLPQRGEGFGKRVVRETVGFRADYYKRTLHLLEEGDELRVAGLRRDVGIDQADAERQRLPLGEVGFDELWPLL